MTAVCTNEQNNSPGSRFSCDGFSLVEATIVMMITIILAAIAVPNYLEAVNAAKIVRAIGEIKHISSAIDLYFVSYRQYPPSLAEVGYDKQLDPWGHPYQYLKIDGLKGKGSVRKDKNLNPLNSDYDLYSMGKDGASVSPLTAKASRDDIVRANNGGFIGLATNY